MARNRTPGRPDELCSMWNSFIDLHILAVLGRIISTLLVSESIHRIRDKRCKFKDVPDAFSRDIVFPFREGKCQERY